MKTQSVSFRAVFAQPSAISARPDPPRPLRNCPTDQIGRGKGAASQNTAPIPPAATITHAGDLTIRNYYLAAHAVRQ